MKKKKTKRVSFPFQRGLKDKKVQVTFEGDKHPTSGSVFGFSWYDLKHALESRLPADDRVISFSVNEWGLNVYHDKIMSVGEGMKVHNDVTGRSEK